MHQGLLIEAGFGVSEVHQTHACGDGSMKEPLTEVTGVLWYRGRIQAGLLGAWVGCEDEMVESVEHECVELVAISCVEANWFVTPQPAEMLWWGVPWGLLRQGAHDKL